MTVSSNVEAVCIHFIISSGSCSLSALTGRGLPKAKRVVTAIVTVVLTFVLTGFAGNLLVQRWQMRNWVVQQRFLGEQKQYDSLNSLCDDLIMSSGQRLWKMRSLLRSLSQSRDEIITRRL